MKSFLTDINGATAIEYAIMAAGIAMAVITTVDVLGQNVKTTFFDKVVAALISPS